MPIHETEAIVLRRYPLSESDRIIVFFTKGQGKLRAVGHGVKKPKSRLAGCLEPLNHVRLEYYAKEGADLAQIRQCEIIHAYLGKNPSLKRIYAFTYFTELAHEFVQENQANVVLFRLFLAVASAGEQMGVNQALVRYFEFWSLKLNGLLPNFGHCSICDKCLKEVGFFAWIEEGEGRCQECAGNKGLHVRSDAAASLNSMSAMPPAQYASMTLTESAAADLERLSQRLLERHLEKRLKSYAALSEVLRIG